MGFATSLEMPGRVLEEALPAGTLLDRPVEAVSSYGRRSRKELVTLAREIDDAAELKRLQGLGYVDGGPVLKAREVRSALARYSGPRSALMGLEAPWVLWVLWRPVAP